MQATELWTIWQALLGVFDDGYALQSVVRPLVDPQEGTPRIDFVTRLRKDARLYLMAPTQRRRGQRGPAKAAGGRGPGKFRKRLFMVAFGA